MPRLLADADSQKFGRHVLVNFEPKRFSDPHTGCTTTGEQRLLLAVFPLCESRNRFGREGRSILCRSVNRRHVDERGTSLPWIEFLAIVNHRLRNISEVYKIDQKRSLVETHTQTQVSR
jgi:hypothetical protein